MASGTDADLSMVRTALTFMRSFDIEAAHRLLRGENPGLDEPL
jgi:3-hydroxyisobutyrate dehydrogenase